MNIGIIGAGWIAEKMASTISKLDGIKTYAIASRDIEKAKTFAAKYGVTKAYGSYKELINDPEVELVYIATPHSHHFEQASMAIEAEKPVLCEKAFTANAREAEALLNFAHAKGVFITEAIWTRYMPLSIKIKELLDEGVAGRLRLLNASLCYALEHKQRIMDPALCGGALLDVGVYCLNFARMYFGSDIVNTSSFHINSRTGVDLYESICMTYTDGRIANLQAGALCRCNREGVICGDAGYVVVDNINCPEKVTVYDGGYNITAEYKRPENQISGYEYQILACRDALEKGALETPFMPHQETLNVMRQMDALRKEWGVTYPMD